MNRLIPNYRTMFKIRARRVWALILTPGCLLGPAIWLSDSESARIHQHVCQHCHSSLSVLQSKLVFFGKVILWYSILVWVSLIITWLINLQASDETRHTNCPAKNDSIWKRIKAWAYLGLWLGVKPQTYFRLKLHATPRNQWVNYAFPQEQSNWHGSLGYDDERKAKTELSDKQATELRLTENNIPCVTTIHAVKRGSLIHESAVFSQQNYFIKPTSLHGMRGCASLNYCIETTNYQLRGHDLSLNHISIDGQENIAHYLQKLSNQVDLLIQTRLSDHNQLKLHSDDRDISTLRVITCHSKEQIYVVHAMLEVALKNELYWAKYGVDITTGALKLTPELLNNAGFKAGFILPFWPQVCQYTRDAHRSFDLIKTVSWDVCISPNGPIIIEGNSGWGLSAPQTTCQSPLLKGKLSAAYAHNL